MLAGVAENQCAEENMQQVVEGIGVQGEEVRRDGWPSRLYWGFAARPHSHHVRPESSLDWNRRPARWSSGPFLSLEGKLIELE